MKARDVRSVTSNDEYVRMRIYDGALSIDEGAAEILRIDRLQLEREHRCLDKRFAWIDDGLTTWRQRVAAAWSCLTYRPHRDRIDRAIRSGG